MTTWLERFGMTDPGASLPLPATPLPPASTTAVCFTCGRPNAKVSARWHVERTVGKAIGYCTAAEPHLWEIVYQVPA